MAVFLCRSGEAVHPPPTELRNAPRLVVRSEPVTLGLDHRGKKINARSDSHYACAEPTREEVWSKNYARRSAQLTQCGFHGPPSCPYRDVGEVELDDRRLIQEGIGQSGPDKEDQRQYESAPEAAVNREGLHHQQQQATVSMTSPYRVRMRAKTPSQFPTELARLDKKLEGVEERLELVRKGRGLFKLMRDREMERLCEEQLVAQMEEDARRSAWAEPGVTSETSLSNVNITSVNGSASPEASVLKRESSVALDLEAIQEKLAFEERTDEETPQLSNNDKTIVEQWYRQLCALVWILEAMRMENPSHMTPLSQCWRLDRPPPDEAKGKKRAELVKTQLHKFDAIVKEHKQVKEKPKLFSVAEMIKTQQNTAGQINPKSVKSAVRWSHSEEERMKRQKKLSPGQMENLLIMLEEELNYSKKQSRSRINALMREADQARTQGSEVVEKKKTRMSWQLPPISLDVSNVERQFSETEEAKRMIVHEQLKAMERDHGKATQQRFGSLEVSGNIWKDLKVMRQGVEIETTSMARRRLLMNYEWFPELISQLPDLVKTDHYCRKLLLHLAQLADHMSAVGPWKMSKKKLTQVLASFHPWELYNPDIEAAIQFLIQHVIYIVAEDYSKWLHKHKLAYDTQKSKTAAMAHAVPSTHNKLHVTF